jgi:predicted MFS family arabinose efflux permease
VLYATRELGLEPAVLGGLLAALGIGGLLGAAVAGRVTRYFGFGRTVIATVLIWAIAALLLGLTNGPPAVVIPMVGAAFLGVGVVSPIFNTNMASLRQAITPDRLLGRVTGASRFVSLGLVPIGAVVGGWLSEAVGLRATVFAAAGMIFLAVLLLWLSPVRALRSLPT